MRSFDRGPLDLRPLTITPGVSRHAEGSAELRIGHTWVRVTCSVEERVPPSASMTSQSRVKGRAPS